MRPRRPPIRRSLADQRRTATVAAIVRHMTAELGRVPTNREVASFLARSEASIARLRRLLDGGAP